MIKYNGKTYTTQIINVKRNSCSCSHCYEDNKEMLEGSINKCAINLIGMICTAELGKYMKFIEIKTLRERFFEEL